VVIPTADLEERKEMEERIRKMTMALSLYEAVGMQKTDEED
jgi:hypothetical protein